MKTKQIFLPLELAFSAPVSITIFLIMPILLDVSNLVAFGISFFIWIYASMSNAEKSWLEYRITELEKKNEKDNPS